LEGACEQEAMFAKTDIVELEYYIASLKSQVGALDGDIGRTRRPIYFDF